MAVDLERDDSIADGVHLLISILLCYPQIGTVKFVPEDGTFRFTVMFQPNLSAQDLKTIQVKLQDSLELYHWLEKTRDYTFKMKVHYDEQLILLTIARDVVTLNKNEIELMIQILVDLAKDSLVADYEHGLMEDELLLQEEVLESMLKNTSSQLGLHSLYGIREDGRVLVFNK